MSTTSTTVASQVARWLVAGDETLLSVLTRPSVPARGVGVIFLNGGHGGSSAGKNRIYTRMAADLADRGFHTIRLEWQGIGDSTGEIDEFVLHEPFVPEALAAAQALRDEGVDQIAIYGECLGARAAISAAEELPDLAATYLVTLLLRDGAQSDQTPQRVMAKADAGFFLSRLGKARYLLSDSRRRDLYLRVMRNMVHQKVNAVRRAISGDRLPPWVSFQVVKALEALGQRAIPVNIVYGTSEFDEHKRDFEAIQDGLKPLRHPSLQYEIIDEMIAGYRTLHVQERLISMVCEWFDEMVPGHPAGANPS